MKQHQSNLGHLLISVLTLLLHAYNLYTCTVILNVKKTTIQSVIENCDIFHFFLLKTDIVDTSYSRHIEEVLTILSE